MRTYTSVYTHISRWRGMDSSFVRGGCICPVLLFLTMEPAVWEPPGQLWEEQRRKQPSLQTVKVLPCPWGAKSCRPPSAATVTLPVAMRELGRGEEFGTAPPQPFCHLTRPPPLSSSPRHSHWHLQPLSWLGTAGPW